MEIHDLFEKQARALAAVAARRCAEALDDNHLELAAHFADIAFAIVVRLRAAEGNFD